MKLPFGCQMPPKIANFWRHVDAGRF
jgi:hypothetical protein